MTFWIYENLGGGRQAVIHEAGCRHCNHGQGMSGGTEAPFSFWHGPFDTLQDAQQYCDSLSEVRSRRHCSRCLGGSVAAPRPAAGQSPG